MRISDWSSDVCSSDLAAQQALFLGIADEGGLDQYGWNVGRLKHGKPGSFNSFLMQAVDFSDLAQDAVAHAYGIADLRRCGKVQRSEEHTSELQSLMRITYAVFCLKKKNQQITNKTNNIK